MNWLSSLWHKPDRIVSIPEVKSYATTAAQFSITPAITSDMVRRACKAVEMETQGRFIVPSDLMMTALESAIYGEKE